MAQMNRCCFFGVKKLAMYRVKSRNSHPGSPTYFRSYLGFEDLLILGGSKGMFPVFSLLGNPLIDMDLRNACTCIESTLLYSCTFPQTCVF